MRMRKATVSQTQLPQCLKELPKVSLKFLFTIILSAQNIITGFMQHEPVPCAVQTVMNLMIFRMKEFSEEQHAFIHFHH